MGKKKSQTHVQQSMGQMVSKAALAQMAPSIERYVQSVVQSLGAQLANQTSATIETLFSRLVVLEDLLCEKLNVTKEQLVTKVSDLEDEKDGLKVSETTTKLGDTVRLEVSSKLKDQTEYQGLSRVKVSNVGSGQALGVEIEKQLVGMGPNETKEIDLEAGLVKVTVNRVSVKKEGSSDNNTSGQ